MNASRYSTLFVTLIFLFGLSTAAHAGPALDKIAERASTSI